MDAAAGATHVCRLARVLLEVRPLDADARAVGQLQPAVDVERLVVLADLVRLRHVGVEVVLAVERARPDLAVEGESDPHRQLDRPPVEDGERARQPERDGIDVRVRLVPEAVGARREQLRRRVELDVHLETDHQVEAVDDERLVVDQTLARLRDRGLRLRRGGRHDALPSRVFAARNMIGSPRAGASTCTPTGRSWSPVPKGTLIPGCPERLLGIV